MAQSIETVTAYIETVEPKWRIAYQQVLDVVSQNLPAGFELTMQYGMPWGKVVFASLILSEYPMN